MSKGVCERLCEDLDAYLSSKFSDRPPHEIQEMASYISNKFSILLTDAINERDAMWRRSLRSPKVKKTYAKHIDEMLDKAGV